MVVFAPSVSHKLVGLIENPNNILQQALKKMQKFEEEWEDTLFYTTSQVNSWMIKHLGYSFNEIIIGI